MYFLVITLTHAAMLIVVYSKFIIFILVILAKFIVYNYNLTCFRALYSYILWQCSSLLYSDIV